MQTTNIIIFSKLLYLYLIYIIKTINKKMKKLTLIAALTMFVAGATIAQTTPATTPAAKTTTTAPAKPAAKTSTTKKHVKRHAKKAKKAAKTATPAAK